MPLPVHVEGAHNVVFNEQDEETIVEEQAENSIIKLMAYFRTNQADPHANPSLH